MDQQDYDSLPEASHDAVHAARDHAQKVELAREVQNTRVAEATAERITQNVGDILQSRLEHVLARGTEQDKSIILARVPYICQDIKGINAALEEIKKMMAQVKTDLDAKDEKNAEKYDKKYVTQDQFSPFKWGATLIATLVVTAIVGALLALVIIHK